MKGKIKRVTALLLSLIMVLTMLPTTAFAAEEGEETAGVISSVNLTGFAVPSVGDSTYTIGNPAATAESGEGYTFNSGTWYNATGVNQFSGTFADGGTYIALFSLKAETGYEFAPTESFSATVKDANGNPVTVESVEVTNYSRVNDTAYVYVEFTLGTPKIEIDTIEATLSVPVAGQNAGTLTLTVPADSNYTATIESVEGNVFLTATTFAAGQSYSGRILFTPNEGYRFADLTTVQIDNVGYFSHMSTNTSTGAYEYAITFSCPSHGVAASLSDVDFGTLAVGYSQPDAANPTITNTGTEVFNLTDAYAKVELTARDVTAFTCGWNSGGGAISVGGSSDSKPWVRPVTGFPAGTYAATLTLYYDYDGSGTDYDWEVMDTATVTFTVEEEEADITTGNATVTAPVAGQTPNFTATSDDPEKYSVEIVEWSDVETGTVLSTSDIFEGGKQYTVIVRFSAVGSNSLSYDNTFTINGNSTGWSLNGLRRTYTFTASGTGGGGSEETTVSATVANVTVTGTVDTDITVQEFRIYVEGDTFGMSIPADITDWFKNIPTGLTVTKIECAGGRLTVRVSGTPTAASEEVMEIVIPDEYLESSTTDVTVTTNANAKYEITAPLAAPTNPRWEDYVAKWDAVDGAEEYELHLWRGDFSIFGTTTSNTQYDVSAYMAPGQTYSFSAYAIKGSERSIDATSAEITVPGSLGTISGIAWDGYKLSWNAVTNAVSYNVKLYRDGVQVATRDSVPATSYDFTTKIAANGDGVYYAKVEADYYVFGNTMATGESGEITVGTPKIEIDTIKATLSLPVAGQKADTLALTVPAGSHYTATIVSVENNEVLTATTFAAGQSYSGRVIFTPNEGYWFADSSTAQIDNVGYFSRLSKDSLTGAHEYSIVFSCPDHGVAASISDVDFGTLAVGYSEPDAANPTVTNTGTEVFHLTGAYAKVALTAGNTDAFSCGWNGGPGSINVGGSSNSKPWVRPRTGLNAGTYTATLTLYYDYDGSETTYDWAVMDTATVTLTVEEATPLAITTQPVSVTVAEGATATVKVVAEGEGLKYQWYFTSNASDSSFSKSGTTTATYSTEMNADRNGRKVYCVVTDKYGNSVKSNTVTLSMGTALKITTQPSNVTVANGAIAKTTVVATGDGLKYQWYYTLNASDSTFFKSSTTTATYSTVMNADRAGRQVYCVVTDKYGNSVQSNTVTLSMSAVSLKITSQPTNVTVANGATAKTTVKATGEGLKYQWYYTLNASGSTFYKSSTTTATYSTVMNADRDGRKVYCVVTDKYGNSVKSNTVTLSMSAASLKITSQPTNVTVANGATAKTTVVATGEGLKYQWYYTLNASDSTFYKSSTTTATYSTVMNADRDGRKVYCVVTDKYGNSVTSNTVTLSMSTASLKITTQPKNVTVANGATAKTTVKATGEGLKYQWYYTLNASDSTFYKSSTTTATYSTVMNADRDGRQVYCVVTDKYGNSVTSNTVTLSMR